MVMRIAIGADCLYPGAFHRMACISNGRTRPQAVEVRTILAGVFGSNDIRHGSSAATACHVVVHLHRERSARQGPVRDHE